MAEPELLRLVHPAHVLISYDQIIFDMGTRNAFVYSMVRQFGKLWTRRLQKLWFADINMPRYLSKKLLDRY